MVLGEKNGAKLVLSYVSGLSLFLCLVKTRVSNWNCQKDTLKSGNFCFCKIFLHLFMLSTISSHSKQKNQIKIYPTKIWQILWFFQPPESLEILGGFCQMGWERSEMTEETFLHRNYNSTLWVKFKEKQHTKKGRSQCCNLKITILAKT